MVRSKIAIPQKFNHSKGSKPQPSWFKKYCQVRKKLQETREDEEPVVNPGSPASIPHMQQQEDDVAHLQPSNLPQVLLIEYHKSEEEAETAEVPKSELAPPTDGPTQPPPDAPVQEDEEFIQILDEDPLVEVSKVPFQEDSAAKKSKKKVISSIVPQRRSKRKLKLKEDSSSEAPPQKKQSTSSTPMISAADVTPVIMLFAAEKYKVNSIGLPYPTLLYRLLISQGFNKDEGEEEEKEEPPLQVDSRHMEGKHYNDMEVAASTTTKHKETPSLVRFLEQKLMQVKEELARTLQLKDKLEIEKDQLVVLLRQARDSAEEIIESTHSDEQESHTEGERVCVLLTCDLLVDFTVLFGFVAVGFALWSL
ncbi:unnamed protein product [Cuscuta campestris]|uniref:Uncharacterized protein n=1 Tax=Cuscuta campestris TaxID=132261 RepID=A0A484N8X3_9ASTE|nr:unnamed protein product [Cuscuta campestris]